jgi:hypothetical protein
MPSYDDSEPIKIYENNPSEGFFRPSGDIRKDQIWFLERSTAEEVRMNPEISKAGVLGVREPEEIQPPEKEIVLRKPLLLK